ncbi:hypothetical protein GGU10DRAFT_413024, partial [Lentinula aff. detonsa]
MSSPSEPLGIPRHGSQSRSATPAGTPDLRALKAQVISGTPPLVGPSRTESPLDLPVDLDDLPDEEKAKILRRHLVSREERERERIDTQEGTPSFTPESPSQTRRSSGSGRIAREDSEPFPVPYAAPGADVTHDIYKWHLNAQRQARRVRSASFSAATRPAPDPAFEHIHESGGFRRDYVLLRAGNEEGNEETRVFVNNFIDLLFLFGHFAGEDLEEEDEDNKDKDDLEYAGASTSVTPAPGFGALSATESSPLLGNKPRMSRYRYRSRRRAASMSTGNATVGQAVLMLLKGFVGTGVLFLGKAFGDIGGALYGPWMRHLILNSIVLSQIGFVRAYMIFVSENLQAFASSVTNCVQYVPVNTTALVADAYILVGLVYIFSSEVGLVIDRGARDVQMFNPKNFSL